MLAMSYDEYLEYFERVRKARAASSSGGGGSQSNGPTPPLPASQTVRNKPGPGSSGPTQLRSCSRSHVLFLLPLLVRVGALEHTEDSAWYT